MTVHSLKKIALSILDLECTQALKIALEMPVPQRLGKYFSTPGDI